VKITLLGTGTPTPSQRRAGSSYLVEAAGELFLFDCGPGSQMRLLQAGVAPTRITQLFITHWHYDHFADLPHHVLRHWDQGAGRVPDLPIYGPPPIREIVPQLFGERGVFGPDLVARTQSDLSLRIYEARGGQLPRRFPQPAITQLVDGAIVARDTWTITALEVPHCQPHLTSLAYRLDTAEGSFVYSGDSGPCDAMVRFAAKADVFVHMCHYLTGTEHGPGMLRGCGSHKAVAALARDAQVRSLVLTHITEQLDVPGIRERAVHEISAIFGGHVIWSEDLLGVEPHPIEAAPLC
jgi:ribonuclease BN (tRNA processing enzyme)